MRKNHTHTHRGLDLIKTVDQDGSGGDESKEESKVERLKRRPTSERVTRARERDP